MHCQALYKRCRRPHNLCAVLRPRYKKSAWGKHSGNPSTIFVNLSVIILNFLSPSGNCRRIFLFIIRADGPRRPKLSAIVTTIKFRTVFHIYHQYFFDIRADGPRRPKFSAGIVSIKSNLPNLSHILLAEYAPQLIIAEGIYQSSQEKSSVEMQRRSSRYARR